MSKHPFLFIGLMLLPFAFSAAFENPVTIGRILINRKNVFDTGSPLDRRFPYSWANKLHIVTQEKTVRNDLLFKEGDVLDEELLRESERLMRRRGFYRYVKIVADTPVNGQADVHIETEDVWTTSIQLAYNLAGGKQFYRVGFLENNFLGTGKMVGAFIRQDIDRFVKGVSYKDQHFLNSRWEFFAGYGSDQKGREFQTYLEKPHYSALTRHSEGGAYNYSDDEDRLFENGVEVTKFQHEEKKMRVFYSYALRPSAIRSRRVTLAHERESDRFDSLVGKKPDNFVTERDRNSILAGYGYQNIRFRKVRGLTTFDRDEDINFGLEFVLEGGPTLESLGSTQDGGIVRGSLKRTFQPGSHVWYNAMDMTSRIENEQAQNGMFRFRSQYYFPKWVDDNTAYIRGDWATSKNIDAENQFLLGGENGLRGYSVRQFSGENKILLTIENRQNLIYDWLRLVSIGWAVFADSGLVWEPGPFSLDRVKSDIGLGLRLAPSRSVDSSIIRIDVAYALQDNQRSSRFVLNVGGELMFGDRKERKFDQ